MSTHDIPSISESKGGSRFWMLAGILFVILILIIGGMKLVNSDSATEVEDAARAAVRIKNLAELQAADSNTLTTYGWNNQAKGIVRIPIQRAMELTLPQLNSAPSSAVPVSTEQKQP